MVNHDLYNELSDLYAKQWMKLGEMDGFFYNFFFFFYSMRSAHKRMRTQRIFHS